MLDWAARLTPLLLAAVASPQPGTVKSFGDWAVGCDNALSCEMTSLVSDSVEDDLARAGWLTLSRSGARGDAPAVSISARPALPAIRAAAIPAGDAVAPAPKIITAMQTVSGCEPDGAQDTPAQAFRLDGGNMLVLLACGAGAYNLTSAAYVVGAGGGGQVRTR